MAGQRHLGRPKRGMTSIAPWPGAREARTLPAPKIVPVGAGWNERCVEAWREDAVARGLAPQTIRGYDRSIRQFVDWAGRMSLLDVGPTELRSYFDDLRSSGEYSMGDIGNRFTGISSLYDYLAHERIIADNLVPHFRRRYLALRLRESNKRRFERRPFLSLAQMRRLVRSVSDVQEKLLIVLLAKTGVRISEIVSIDIADIDWRSQTIQLKPARKRTHLLAFFDEETARLLRKWISIRALWTKDTTGPLFLGQKGERMSRIGGGKIVVRTTRRIGLHKPGGEKHERVTPHTLRHWFTTHLYRAGMKREHIKILRGDALPETMDIYLTIDYASLRADYLRCIPTICGGPRPPPERRRERKTKNPTFGFLTPEEAARPRGLQPRKVTMDLRKRIANDLARGRLRRPKDYVAWLVEVHGKKLTYARPLVSNQLRLLGVPSLQKGPREKGWKLARKAIQQNLGATTKSRRTRTIS